MAVKVACVPGHGAAAQGVGPHEVDAAEGVCGHEPRCVCVGVAWAVAVRAAVDSDDGHG